MDFVDKKSKNVRKLMEKLDVELFVIDETRGEDIVKKYFPQEEIDAR
jgi:Ni2+-binding GTPase involved in maturation of urease and hydrogenase